MRVELTEVELTNPEKKLILELASFLVTEPETIEDLNNVRRKWIRFTRASITDVIGELSYHFNRCKSERKSSLLDALICHLEVHERDLRTTVA